MSSAELNTIEEYEQSCTVALTDALHSVTEHHAFLRTFSSSSSAHNTELLHHTRAQFLIQLGRSVSQLQSLIDTQEALVNAVHQSAPATNVPPVIYQEIISTAIRVPDSVARAPPSQPKQLHPPLLRDSSSTQFDEASLPAFTHHGRPLACKSPVFPTTRIADSTVSTTLGSTSLTHHLSTTNHGHCTRSPAQTQ